MNPRCKTYFVGEDDVKSFTDEELFENFLACVDHCNRTGSVPLWQHAGITMSEVEGRGLLEAFLVHAKLNGLHVR